MSKRKRIIVISLLPVIMVSLLVSCSPVKLTLVQASLKPRAVMATPILVSAMTTRSTWESEAKPGLKHGLQENVYGFLPASSSTQLLEKKPISEGEFNNKAKIEEYSLSATAVFNGQENETPPFNMVVVSPMNAEGPVPVILMQTFCPNNATIPVDGVSPPSVGGFSCDGDGMMDSVFSYVFGRYITTPPIEMILDAGYAIATIYPSEYIPDQSQAGMRALTALSSGHENDETRWGAIAAWGWGYSRMIDILWDDPRFDPNRFISYGHSRYGKAALFASAFDDRISAVLSHQSGTGGAALNRKKNGESVEEITQTYPHWFSAAYAKQDWDADDIAIDQHALLALIAPRPVFLGNARRDVWSDPNGSFRSAQGASEIYKLYDKTGLKQDTLKSYHPDANISFYLRPGTHGVVKEDWPAFLAFLDSHLK